MEKEIIKVTSKREGIVFASSPSGSVKVTLHGLTKANYRKYRKGQVIKI